MTAQVCGHLERLSVDLEAAAHPALDALTRKVTNQLLEWEEVQIPLVTGSQPASGLAAESVRLGPHTTALQASSAWLESTCLVLASCTSAGGGADR